MPPCETNRDIIEYFSGRFSASSLIPFQAVKFKERCSGFLPSVFQITDSNASNIPFQLTTSVWKFLKISSCEISDLRFGVHTPRINVYAPRFCNFNFMAIINLKIYQGFDRENLLWCNLTPLLMVKSLINVQTYYPHRIKIASTKIMIVYS